MLAAGCDVGSLTAEAIILKDGKILSHAIMGTKATAEKSAQAVMGQALSQANLKSEDIGTCYSTGYGRYWVPFAKKNISEISCHGMGAFWLDPEVRTVIDIGGQDCKVISVDDKGLVRDFVMNDKCAAGTGRSLEILSAAIDLDLKLLGPVSLKSRKPAKITNKCSIFMELEVLQHIYGKKKTRDIARGINLAVAKRVAALARTIKPVPAWVITGGVSKNPGVIRELETLMGVRFKALDLDPQLVGALGAACFAHKQALERTGR